MTLDENIKAADVELRPGGLRNFKLSVQTRVNYDDLPATVATLQPLIEAGTTHLVLMLTYPYPDGAVARLADEVVETVG